jgi:hypothetical protein
MLLVPRQLQRTGMTGNVPYYGGRFTPAQAYAAAHPSAGRPAPATTPSEPAALPVHGAAATSQSEKLDALRKLLDSGVLTPGEYDELVTRVAD